jgi:hypothetical protein
MRRMSENKKPKILGMIVLAAISLFILSSAKVVNSAGETEGAAKIAVKPLAVFNYSLGANEQFSVNVTAFNAINLHGFRLRLTFDANLLECVAVQEGMLLQAFNSTVMTQTVNNTSGNIETSVNLTSPEAMASGNDTLLGLTFRVKNTGETAIHLDELKLYDSVGSSLSHVTYDGYFNNKFIFDVTMPLALVCVTLVSIFLNQKTEGKLKSTLEGKELKAKDGALLVGLMVVMISVIAFLRQAVAPLMILFLFSYSMLLFMFTYIFSNKRWYLAILPPAIFVLPYIFFRTTDIWSEGLVNVYGVIFAILITLYIANLFSWKSTLIFTGLLTIVDIVMVLVTGWMVQAAEATAGLSLPVIVELPLIPLIVMGGGRLLRMGLGLGDFFFAGLLAIQTYKKYGKRFTLVCLAAMTLSFSIFEAINLTYWKIPFPGTLMIICGWLPPATFRIIKDRKNINPV